MALSVTNYAHSGQYIFEDKSALLIAIIGSINHKWKNIIKFYIILLT